MSDGTLQALLNSWDSPSLILLDWDDTILPTFSLKETNYSAPAEGTAESLEWYELIVIQSLDVLLSAGSVVIVTASSPGWVEQSCKMFLPTVWPHLQSILVCSSRKEEIRNGELVIHRSKRELFVNLDRMFQPKVIVSIGDGWNERDALSNLRKEGQVRKCLSFLHKPSLTELASQHLLMCLKFEGLCQHSVMIRQD